MLNHHDSVLTSKRFDQFIVLFVSSSVKPATGSSSRIISGDGQRALKYVIAFDHVTTSLLRPCTRSKALIHQTINLIFSCIIQRFKHEAEWRLAG